LRVRGWSLTQGLRVPSEGPRASSAPPTWSRPAPRNQESERRSLARARHARPPRTAPAGLTRVCCSSPSRGARRRGPSCSRAWAAAPGSRIACCLLARVWRFWERERKGAIVKSHRYVGVTQSAYVSTFSLRRRRVLEEKEKGAEDKSRHVGGGGGGRAIAAAPFLCHRSKVAPRKGNGSHATRTDGGRERDMRATRACGAAR